MPAAERMRVRLRLVEGNETGGGARVWECGREEPLCVMCGRFVWMGMCKVEFCYDSCAG